MIDDIRWLEIPAAEWQGGAFGLYDDSTRTVRILQVLYVGDNQWLSVPTVSGRAIQHPRPSGLGEAEGRG